MAITRLAAWEEAHKLTMSVYRVTNDFPKHEIYGLTSQLRRAAISVPSNIVEGKARETAKEFVRFLYIARGSIEELRYQLYLSKELDYISSDDFRKLINGANHTGKLINGLIKSLKQ